MKLVKTLVCSLAVAGTFSAWAADPVPLPAKMDGKWGQRQNKAEVELIQMESPTKAKLMTIFWDGCTRRGETTAEFKDDTWTFVVPGGMKCEDITVTMTKLQDKNRFEGKSKSLFRGSIAEGDVYLEW